MLDCAVGCHAMRHRVGGAFRDMAERDWLTDIRRFRQENDLTQHELAMFLGVSQKTVSRWERGADQPGPEIRRRLELLLQETAESPLPTVWETIRNAAVPLALVDGSGRVLVASKSYSQSEAAPATDDHHPPTVLVIEDDEAVLKATQAVLKRWNILAVGASSGEAALQLLAEGDIIPKVAIIDFLLPGGMDGVDVASALRQTFPNLPVLIVSGEANAERMVKITHSKLPFVAKPVNPEEIRMVLMSLLPQVK